MLAGRKGCLEAKDPFIIFISLRLTQDLGFALELDDPASLASSGSDENAPIVNGGDIEARWQHPGLMGLFILFHRLLFGGRFGSNREMLVPVQ
jgi:hypothetical protein